MSRTQPLRDLHGARDVDRGGAADAEALLLQEVERHGEGRPVRDLEGNVWPEVVCAHVARDSALANSLRNRVALGLEHALVEPPHEHGPARVGQRDFDVGVLRAQVGAHTRQRAACACGAGEGVDLTAGLGPDLRTSRGDVGATVGEVAPAAAKSEVRVTARHGERAEVGNLVQQQ